MSPVSYGQKLQNLDLGSLTQSLCSSSTATRWGAEATKGAKMPSAVVRTVRCRPCGIQWVLSGHQLLASCASSWGYRVEDDRVCASKKVSLVGNTRVKPSNFITVW